LRKSATGYCKTETPKSLGAAKMSDPLDEKINTALSSLNSVNDPAKLAEVLGIVKTGYEIQKTKADTLKVEEDTRKTAIDGRLAAKQSWGAILTPLVPLASVLTVFATIFINNQQLRSANEQAERKYLDDKTAREQANWKEFEDALDKDTPDKLYSSSTFVSRLRIFSTGGKHDAELLDITKQFMLRLSSASAFKDIWKITFKEANSENIDQVVELARGIRRDYDSLISECKSANVANKFDPTDDRWIEYMGSCSPTITDDEVTKKYSDASELKRVKTLRQKENDNSSLQYFLSTEISNFLQKESNKQTGSKNIDVSGIYFLAAHLENVDFSQINLTGTAISVSSLENAILAPKGVTFDFRNSDWWNVEKIDQEILKQAIASAYPIDSSNPALFNIPKEYSVSEDEYRAKIAKLCTKNMKICLPECLRFGSRASIGDPKCDPKNN
jgi:hypothetical protein